MKTYKLTIHQKVFSSKWTSLYRYKNKIPTYTILHYCITILDSELIVNSKDFPNAVIGDVVEVYHTGSKENVLLLQIMAFKDDIQSKGK